MPERTRRLAILGAGTMGQALIRGLISAGVYSPRDIVAADSDKERLGQFSEETGVETAGNVEATTSASTVLIAVKPIVVPDVLEEISGYVGTDQLVISIAAGIRIQQIGSRLRSGVPVIRVMPNTPCLVQAGAVALSRGRDATDAHVERALAIFGAVGKAIEVPERLMDSITGLSGSGPAYIYTFIEALTDGGVAAGIPRTQAALLAAQTVYGAAKMVLETGKHPAELRENVTTPGGTAMAGLVALERGAFRATILDAVEAASNRSAELSKPETGP